MQDLHQHYRLVSNVHSADSHCSACNAVYEIYKSKCSEESQRRKNTFVFKCNSQLHRQPSIALLSKHVIGMFSVKDTVFSISGFNLNSEILYKQCKTEVNVVKNRPV